MIEKIFIFLFLFPFLGFCQNFTVSEIDSITNINGSNLDSASNVIIKKKRETIATGGSTQSIYYDIGALGDQTKRKLLKVGFNEYLNYKDGRSTELHVRFYYNDKVLFYIVLNLITNNVNSSTTEFIYQTEIGKPIDDIVNEILTFNLK